MPLLSQRRTVRITVMCLVLLAVEKWKRSGLQAQELSLLWHAELALLCKGKLSLAKIWPDSNIFWAHCCKVFQWSPTTCPVKPPFYRAGALLSKAVSSTVLAGTQVSWCQCFDLLQTCCLSQRYGEMCERPCWIHTEASGIAPGMNLSSWDCSMCLSKAQPSGSVQM